MATAPARPEFYKYLGEGTSLDSYVHDQIRVRLAGLRTAMLDERNIHTYRHGDRWTTQSSADDPSRMHSMSAESTIHALDIINHETGILEKYISAMAEQLYADLMKHLYQTVAEGADAVGNTIGRSQHCGDIPAGFLAMLEKIEFGVDRHGSAQRPSLHVAPETGAKFLQALKAQPPDYHLKVETISLEKEKKAIAREAERISRFRWERS